MSAPGHDTAFADSWQARRFLPVACVALMALIWHFFPMPATPLVTAGALLAVVIAWIRPVIPALFCIAFSAFRLQEAYPLFHPYQLPMLSAAWTALGLAFKVTGSPFALRFSPLLLATATLAVWTTVACLWSLDPESSWLYWSDVYVKIIFVTVAATLVIRSDRDFLLLIATFAASGAALGVATIWNYLTGSQLVEVTRATVGLDVGSSLGDPNDLALILMITLAFAGSAFLQYKRRLARLVLAGCILLILTGISLTQSRGGLLGVVAATVVLAWRHIPSKTTALAVTGLAAVLLYASMDIGGRVSGGRGEEGFGESAQLRVELWGIAFRQFIAHPIVGIGPQTFYRIAEAFTGRAVTVHNTLLQAAVESGLPGLTAFIGVIFAAIATNWKVLIDFDGRSDTRSIATAALGCQAAIAGYCAAAFFLSQAFSWSFYLVIIPSLALSLFLVGAKQRTDLFR